MNLYIRALLCLALCLIALTSCGGSAAETTTDAAAETVTEAAETEAPIPAPDLSQYVLVRPDGKDEYLTVFHSLRAQIKRVSGVELTPASDLVIANRQPPEFEILLGQTRRELSQSLYDSLPHGGYAVVYRDGKIAIAGRGDEPLAAAVTYFIDHYFVDRVFTVPEESDFRAVYQYENYYPVLEGKSINVMGDSYVSAGSLPDGKIWPQLLAEKYEMDYRSYGVSGNAIGSAAASGTPMVQRYTQMRGGVDIVFVVGGRNDYNQSYPVGKVGDTTADTFCGALAVLIDGLRAKYPDSLILFSTSWYVNDDMKAYTDATLAVCEAKGIPCYHAADPSKSGVLMYQPSFRSQYCVKPSDVSHLNAAGMKLVLPKFEAFIAEEAAKFFKE
ncbi:MAG: SGNH/GDSL hydrolase family protein [Clostridia bacterium]|nr:SGNH/GDSL hydrolase family protein [Clostridia bacterium]